MAFETWGQVGRLRGRGTYGEVFAIETRYVVKIMKPRHATREEDIIWERKEFTSMIERELSILKAISGEIGVISLKDSFITKENNLYTEARFIYESYEGNLHLLLLDKKLSSTTELSIMKQLASGLHVCHQLGIVHRDIKTENILYQGTEPSIRVVLTDFGLSKFITPPVPISTSSSKRIRVDEMEEISTDPSLSREIYTLFYRPFEYLLVQESELSSHKSTFSGDIWALACVWVEIVLKGKVLFAYNEEDCGGEVEHALRVHVFMSVLHGNRPLSTIETDFVKLANETLKSAEKAKMSQMKLTTKQKGMGKILDSIVSLSGEFTIRETHDRVKVLIRKMEREIKETLVTSACWDTRYKQCRTALRLFPKIVTETRAYLDQIRKNQVFEVWSTMLHPYPRIRPSTQCILSQLENVTG